MMSWRDEYKARRARLGIVEGRAIVPIARVRPTPRLVEKKKPKTTQEKLLSASERYANKMSNDRVRLLDVEHYVCVVFQVTGAELRSAKRGGKALLARHAVFYIGAKLTSMSIAQMGRALNRDHTSVLSALKKFPLRMLDDAALRAAVDSIIQVLQEEKCMS
jgi:hypothetical protein